MTHRTLRPETAEKIRKKLKAYWKSPDGKASRKVRYEKLKGPRPKAAKKNAKKK